jgi:hypothetical protein
MRPGADIFAISDNSRVKIPGSRMDDSEHAADEYLRSCGFHDPVYEPDGKVPPDFVIEGWIAVEVRRLNQMCKSNTNTLGLEQLQRSFEAKIPFLLKDIGPSRAGNSWFVVLQFKRPLPAWRKLRNLIGQELQAFAQDASLRTENDYTICIVENLTIHLSRASSTRGDLFVFGGYSDLNAGGFVIPELEENMKICIREKANAIAPFRPKYSHWWLVLIDRISYAGIRSADVVLLRSRLPGLADWDRVVLVSPIDRTRGLQIWPPAGPNDRMSGS